ncbi:MAG: hypothetical protein AB8W37_12860 [Arsenophonus endosymbiont of Dermacentor nuttalli]
MNSANEETYYFSAKEITWLSESMKEDYIQSDSWDYEAKPVPYSVYHEFAFTPAPAGKMLGANEKGDPIWVDILPRPKTEY